ncbi:MAG: hypothetical protein IPM15_09170 [Betaproteobacteria bacterium]|nr:hypothetical protein [Betaproteobacteria bacterium]MCC6247006.1 hypothetical protein [Rubrivivax sp.]MCL4695588.1 hypothetical protein [Burkholderiaceae bacterium]
MARHLAPRDYTAGAPTGDRLAAIAARRAFVSLKLTFADAASGIEGAQAHWLRQQVRAAEHPVDLWLLRASLFAALAGNQPDRRQLRQRLRRAIEAVFAEPQQSTMFGTV